MNQVQDDSNLPDFAVRAHAAQFAILREAAEFLNPQMQPSAQNRFQVRIQQAEETVHAELDGDRESPLGPRRLTDAEPEDAPSETNSAHAAGSEPMADGRTREPRVVLGSHVGIVASALISHLGLVREERNATIELYDTAGLLEQERKPLIRTLHWIDGRIDGLWTTWLDTVAPRIDGLRAAGGPQKSPETDHPILSLPIPWNWNEVERAFLTEQDRRTQRLLLTTGALVALLLLVGSFWWSAMSASAGSYVAMFASAIGCSTLTFLRWRRSTRPLTLWELTLTPLMILTVGLGFMLYSEAHRADEGSAFAASVILMLTVFAVTAVFFDTQNGSPPMPAWTATARVPIEMEDPAYVKLLGDYLAELRVTVLREASDRRKVGNRWNRSFLIVGGLAATLSAGAGFSGLNDSVGEYVAIAALFGAGLTAFVTLVNPAQRSERSNSIASSCQSLADEIDMLMRLDLARDIKDRGLEYVRSQVEKISEQFDTLREVPQRPRLWEKRAAEPAATTGDVAGVR